MNRRNLTYNPALLSDDELVETFVVRQVDLQLIVEAIRDNDGPSNQHVVVVGARGMGKTTLVSRVALAVKRDPELSQRWTPVLFGEESYDVGSVGELWLKALQRLTETMHHDPRWRQAFDAVREEKDEERLRERALGRLLDYARDSHMRILLVVENLDMMLGEQIETDDAWTLRHTLQQHPEIMLLATVVDYDSTFGRQDLPLYGFAREHRLQPLSMRETRELWARIANDDRSERAMIPIHRLTGGNTRLVTIVASFSAGHSFRELMDELTALVDEHTSYFKATIEALPATERRAYSTLADIWAPATSRQVAQRCRMSTSKTSALLARLVARRMVEEVGKEGKSKRYQLAERLYNVYHVLRSRGGEQRARMKGLVEFMAMFYESDGLADIMGKLALEATSLPNEDFGEYVEAYRLLLEKLPDQSRLLQVTPEAFLVRLLQWQFPGGQFPVDVMTATSAFTNLPNRETAVQVAAALGAYFGVDASVDASVGASEIVGRLLDNPRSYVEGTLFAQLDDPTFRSFLVRLLPWLGGLGERIKMLEKLREDLPHDRNVLVALVFGLRAVGRIDEALTCARSLTEIAPEDAIAWPLLGHVLESKEDWEGAIVAYQTALKKNDHPSIRFWVAALLYRIPGRMEEARMLSKTVVFEQGEIHQWLKIAQVENDPERALEIARHLLATGDFATAFEALKVITRTLQAAGGRDRLLTMTRDTIRMHPESPGSVVCIVFLTPWATMTNDVEPWPLFETLLKHPQWSLDGAYCAAAAAPAILQFGRLDPTRVLARLEALDGGAALSPVVVALRMILGGDVSDMPAELVGLGKDVAAVLEQGLIDLANSG
jgi:tetratricopeptide (TPR) repeat protein/energy-coupling factor transporter ATP-binding protein EcfA2